MNKPQLLLFDLGNVLVQLDLDRFSKVLGIDPADAENHFGKGLRILTDQYERGIRTTNEYFESLRSNFENRFDVVTLEKAFESVLTDPMPGMEHLVHRVTTKLPAALVSNTNEYHFSSVLPRIPALQYLPNRYLSYEMGALKPYPEFYDYIIRHEQVKPEEMLFIDDLKANVEAATRAGMRGYQFRNAAELEDELRKLGVL